MNTMDIKPVYDKVKPIFETMKGEENVEVELRFGKHNGSLFDTNMGKETWERVLRRLKKYQGWERVQSSVADVYYNDANNIRITVDEDSGEQTMIQKINVVKDDFKCTPNDIRFSISREIPTFGEYEMDRKRNKTRHSFVRKNLSIDMTISTGDSVDMDSEESCSYQIEMEIVNPQDVKSDDELYNIIHKISDLENFLS
jgi:acetolactate synthase regulatory subunit